MYIGLVRVFYYSANTAGTRLIPPIKARGKLATRHALPGGLTHVTMLYCKCMRLTYMREYDYIIRVGIVHRFPAWSAKSSIRSPPPFPSTPPFVACKAAVYARVRPGVDDGPLKGDSEIKGGVMAVCSN